MKLRPHHALCIQKFTGHGYDEKFTAHMTGTVNTLRDRPETPVELVSGCDDLCAACPNNISGSCSTREKVEAMDSGVLSALSLSAGGVLPWDRLSEMARREIFGTEKFPEICSSCEWYGLCLNTDTNIL